MIILWFSRPSLPLKFDPEVFLSAAWTPFQSFLKTLPTSFRLRWLLWGFDLYSVLVQPRFFIQNLPHPEQVTPLRFGYRFDAFPKARTLRPCFMPQRSWDLPYRVFPSLTGHCSLEQCHPLITLASNSDLTVKQGLSKSPVFRVLPTKESVLFSQDVTLRK